LTPEQPLALTPRRPRDQRRQQTLPLPLSRPSFQPRDQSLPQPLPIVPHQRPLLARPLPPDQSPALVSLKPSVRPPPQPLHLHQNLGRFRSHDFRLTLRPLKGQLLRSLLPVTSGQAFPETQFPAT